MCFHCGNVINQNKNNVGYRKQRVQHQRGGNLQEMVKGDPEMTGLDWNSLEISRSDLKTIKLTELHNILNVFRTEVRG